MAVHTDDVLIANTPLPIQGGNSTPVVVSGTVTTTPPGNASTNITQVGGAALTEGQKTSANSIPVVISSDQTAIPVTITPTTSNTTNITQTVLTANTNATILVANAARKALIIFIPLGTTYIKLGANASSASFTYQCTVPNTTIERNDWAGQIDANSTSGQTVTVTELV
jgi:hypothetical protein